MRKMLLTFVIMLITSAYVSADNAYTNILTLKTKNFVIKIDEAYNHKYKNTAWGINDDFSKKPYLILLNGEHIFDGSGGNNYYKFTNNDYTYQIYEWLLGTSETPPYELYIYKNDKLILDEPAILHEI